MSSMELKQHPLSAAFPAMSAEDFSALVADIKANGQREPIMLLDGMVLDGWHRYRACVECGITPQKFTFDASGDPVAFVLSHNLHRRHLTPSQRAAAVVACTNWAPPHRLKNKQTPGVHLSTNEDLAKAASVHPTTIKDAKAAHKAGLGDAVKHGAMTAKEAARVARGKPAPAKAKKPAAKAPEPPPQDPQVVQERDDAKEAIAILTEENERLNDRLAVFIQLDNRFHSGTWIKFHYCLAQLLCRSHRRSIFQHRQAL